MFSLPTHYLRSPKNRQFLSTHFPQQGNPRDEQRSWIFGQITRKPKQTSRKVNLKQKDRQHTFEYRFNVNDVEVQVCKVFYLRILGYKYDSVITNIFRDMSPNKIRPPYDKRGKHKPKHALTEEDLNQIDEHIESFGPTISHYRRSHAPLRRFCHQN